MISQKNNNSVNPSLLDYYYRQDVISSHYNKSTSSVKVAKPCSIFSQPDTIGMEEVKKACVDILEGLTDNYLQYRELVTPAQWNFLIAVAKEGIVEQPTSTQFLSKYNIGGATSAKRIAKSLSEKELLLPIVGKKRTAYQIYDIFFLRWIESNL